MRIVATKMLSFFAGISRQVSAARLSARPLETASALGHAAIFTFTDTPAFAHRPTK
jgi:hypothetical protein